MPPAGNGVNIGVSANIGQAMRAFTGLGQGAVKLAGTLKSVFSGQGAQQIAAYNKELARLERNYDRITMRVKNLTQAQQVLVQQQKQLQGSGASLGQLQANQKAQQQNQRSLNFWQAKAQGAQAQVAVAQANRPGVGGGGGGIANFFAGQMQQAAGGIGGMVLKALGVAAVAKGASAIAAKVFTTALDEQKLLADLYPKMGHSMATSSPKGYMNNLRNMSMPLGYSGIEGLKIEEAMSSGSSHSGLHGDTRSAMQMARMFGIDAGGEASMLAEGGKMGGFVPGQAKRFAEMLAREIGVNGLGPRAQEVQEATLMLMHRQLSTSATTSASTAMAAQTLFNRTGLPGFTGSQGAGILSNMQSAVTGASSDNDMAFIEAVNRRLGRYGYYNARRARDRGPMGDPKFFAGMFQTARELGANPDAVKDIISRQGGMTFVQSEQLYNKTHGFRDLNEHNVIGLVKSFQTANGGLDRKSAEAMQMPGNQFRKGEATISGLMGRLGTPMVQGIGTLVEKASTEVQKLINIADNTKTLPGFVDAMLHQNDPKLEPGVGHKVGKTGPFRYEAGRGVGGYSISPDGKVTMNDVMGRPIRSPLPGGGPPTAAQMHRHGVPVLPSVGGIAPYHPKNIQRGSVDELHIHVHYDHSAQLHPHVQLAFQGAVEHSMRNIQKKQVRRNLHTVYPKA